MQQQGNRHASPPPAQRLPEELSLAPLRQQGHGQRIHEPPRQCEALAPPPLRRTGSGAGPPRARQRQQGIEVMEQGGWVAWGHGSIGG